jgi:peroxiredoxin
MNQPRSLSRVSRGQRAMTVSWPAALALGLALAGPARAALKITPGQELIYAGTATWKITSTPGDRREEITGPMRFSALVSEADPAKGYSVILMRRFEPVAKTGQDQTQNDAELATLQFGSDLARTGSPDRPSSPISVVMQAVHLPFGPRAEVKSGQEWRQTEPLPAMPPNPLELVYTVSGEAKVGERSGLKIEKKLAQPLPFKQEVNSRTVSLTDYGETIIVDPETGQVLSDQLHQKLEIAAGQQKVALELAAGANLQESHALTPDELASRVKQAAAIDRLQSGLFSFRPTDEGKKDLANAAKEAAAFRGQYAGSPYTPVLAYLDEIRKQIQGQLDREGRLPGLKGSPAPAFALKTLAGQQQTLAAYKGKIVVISFFASWCGPCNMEAPHLEKEVWQKYRSRGVVVVGIDAGEQSEPEKNARQFRDKHSLTYPILVDAENHVMDQYGVTAFPTSLVIDRKGVVRLAEVGFDPAKHTVAETVTALLKSP